MNSELRRSIFSASEWKKFFDRYSRDGIGIFGQKVRQTAAVTFDGSIPKVKSYTIAETFDYDRRITQVFPRWGNPAKLCREVRLDLVYPGSNAAAAVCFSRTNNTLNIEFGKYSGPINQVSVRGEGAPISLIYRKKYLTEATLQDDYISPADNLYPKERLQWDESLKTALVMAQTEDPRNLQIDKQYAQKDLSEYIQSQFDPQGESVQIANSYAQRAKVLIVSKFLPKFPYMTNLFEQIPLFEWITASILASIQIARNQGANLIEELDKFGPDDYISASANRLIAKLTSYSRRRTQRLAVITGFTNTGFFWQDKEIEERYVVVNGVDETTKTTQPYRQLERTEQIKGNGGLAYGQKVDILDHGFVIGKNRRVRIACVARGSQKWEISGIPLFLPVNTLRSSIEDLTVDPTKVRDLLGLNPSFMVTSTHSS